LIGIRVDNLTDKEEMQMSLFMQMDKNKEKQERLDNTIDKLKDKYGYNMVVRAGNINKKIEKR